MVMLDIASDEDIVAIGSMREQEGWYPNRRLLRLAQQSANCRIYVIREGEQDDQRLREGSGRAVPVATTLAVSYGRLGFIGNVIVRPGARQRGLGRKMMEAALDWLAQQGVVAVELDATKTGQPLYERLGFRGHARSLELDLQVVGKRRATDALQMAVQRANEKFEVGSLAIDDLPALAAFDQRVFEGDRLDFLRNLTESPDSQVVVARDYAGAITGYLAVRPMEPPYPGWHLGPWIAQSPDAAAGLFDTVVRSLDTTEPRFFANIPGASGGPIQVMRDWGFNLRPDDVHMRLDLAPENAPVAPHSDAVYAMLSAMVG